MGISDWSSDVCSSDLTAYAAAFGRVLEKIGIRVLNRRVACIGRRKKFDLSLLAPPAEGSVEAAKRTMRQVWLGGAWHEAGIYSRLDLPLGAVIPGPAILEQSDTTIQIGRASCRERVCQYV